MGRRIKKTKPIDRELFYTKDYDSAVSSGEWKTERKFANEIKGAIKSQDLKLKIDKLTRYNTNSFVYSILLQLRREEIYSKLDTDSKHLADRFSHVLFRRKVCNFMLESSQERIIEFRKEFESGESPPAWKDYWEGMKQNKFTNYWFEKAVSLFLKKDIKLIAITGGKWKPYTTEYIVGNIEGSAEGEDCLVVGLKTDLYHISLLPCNSSEPVEDDILLGQNNEKPEEKCPSCDFKYLHLVRHISLNKTCRAKLGEEFLANLKTNAMNRHKLESTERKRRSRQRKQAREDYEEREDRLALKSYYMAKVNERKRKLDPEGMKKEAKETRAKNRKRQKEKKSKM